MRHRPPFAVALTAVLLFTGCGNGSEPHRSSGNGEGALSDSPSAEAKWISQTDPGSGVAFRLPSHATPQQTVNGTIYQSSLDGRFFVSASVVPNRLHLGLMEFARETADNIYEKFSAIKTGPPVHDVIRPELESAPLDRREAYDFWFGFIGNVDERTTWRFTITRCGETTVILQTLDRVPKQQDPRALVLSAHRKLRDGLTCRS